MAALDSENCPTVDDQEELLESHSRSSATQETQERTSQDDAKAGGEEHRGHEWHPSTVDPAHPAQRTADSDSLLGSRIHLTPGDSLLPILAKASTEWHNTEKVDKTAPLRSILVQQLLMHLQQRFVTLEAYEKDSAAWKSMVQAGILTLQGDRPYLTWDSQTRKLVPTKQTPLKLNQVKKMLCQLLEAFKDVHLVQKFHTLKKPHFKTNCIQ